jgi:hypothetical protein
MVTTAAVAVSACVARDDRSNDAEIKCEPINALAYDFPNVEMWHDDKRSKVDKNSFNSNDEMSNWDGGVADKSDVVDVDDFNKISSQQLQQFEMQRVGRGQFNRKGFVCKSRINFKSCTFYMQFFCTI